MKKKSTYRRLSSEERRSLYRWNKEGLSKSEMARRLDRSTSTIIREFNRNTGKRGYRHKQAQFKTNERAKRSGYRTFTEKMRQEIAKKIANGYTPEIISERAKLEKRPMVSREYIYQYLYAEAKQGNDLWKFLPRAKRKRHRRCPRNDGRSRGKIPDQRRIDTRPNIVDSRTRVGDWEGDLINGASGTGHLVTIVDRKSRFTLLDRVQSKQAEEVEQSIKKLFKNLPSTALNTLTLDNGKEFAYHKAMAEHNNIDVYFAYPYHSWERGSNENVNGLVRRIHPKKSSFAEIGVAELRYLDYYLNDRPRKCLGWKTPREVFMASIAPP